MKRFFVLFLVALLVLTTACHNTATPVEKGNPALAIEVPNESVQAAMDRWMALDLGMMGIDQDQPTIHIIRAYWQACQAQGTEPAVFNDAEAVWLDAAAVETFAKETFGIEPKTLRAAAAVWDPAGYREDTGYLIPETVPADTDEIILLEYTPLTDTSFQMKIALKYAAEESFGIPLMVTVDMASGTPVFFHAEPANA